MRKTLFKLHGYLALLACIPLILICLTGSILVFKAELDRLLLPGVASLPTEYAQTQPSRLPMTNLIALVNQQNPEFEIGSWELFDDYQEADRVYLIKHGTSSWYKIWLNPYQGNQLSQPVPYNAAFTDWLLELHYTLLLNDVTDVSELGTLIGLLAGMCLFLLGLTGLIIYRKFWRGFLRFHLDRRFQVAIRDLHKLMGIWVSPVLFIIGITGVYYNLTAYLEETAEQEKGEHLMVSRLYNDQLNISAIIADSRQQLTGFVPTYLLMPYEPKLPITLYGYVPEQQPFASDYTVAISYDKLTGTHLSNYNVADNHFGWQLVDSFRSLHFGTFAGLVSKIIWCAGGILMVIMPLTGVYLWLKRQSKRRHPRKFVANTHQTSE